MSEISHKKLAVRRFIVVFVATAIIFSVIAVAIKHKDLSYLNAFAISLVVAFITAVGWVILGFVMHGVTRPGKGE